MLEALIRLVLKVGRLLSLMHIGKILDLETIYCMLGNSIEVMLKSEQKKVLM